MAVGENYDTIQYAPKHSAVFNNDMAHILHLSLLATFDCAFHINDQSDCQ